MVGDSVAIEVPAEVATLDASRAVEACLVALGPDRCFVASDAERTTDFRATILPTVGGEFVIVLRRGSEERPLAERRILFLPTDPEAYRWQSAGVVTASMVLGEARSEPSPSPPEASPPVAPPQPERAPSAPARPTFVRAVAVDLGGLAGSGVSGGAGRWGGFARGVLRFAPPLLALADVRVAGSEDERGSASSRGLWITGGLGVGVGFEVAGGAVAFEMHAQATVESFSLRAEDELGSEERSRVRWGGRFGGAVVVPVSSAVGLVAGGDFAVAAPTFEFEVAGREAGRLGAFAGAAFLGVRFGWEPGGP